MRSLGVMPRRCMEKNRERRGVLSLGYICIVYSCYKLSLNLTLTRFPSARRTQETPVNHVCTELRAESRTAPGPSHASGIAPGG